MFAPLVKNGKAKVAEKTGAAARQQKAPRSHEQEPDWLAEKFEGPRPNAGPQWGFCTIPIFAPGEQPSLGALRLQPKLAIGAVNDPLEQEADRVTDQLTRMPVSDASISATSLKISRNCAACEAEKEKLQKEAGTAKAVSGEAPPIVHEVLRSPGQPLDDATRAFLEPRFGYDFSRVRVHTDAAAVQSAREVNAHAYTVGQDIVFDAGRFAPGTHEGQRLLSHELTHVVQQGMGQPKLQRDEDAEFEPCGPIGFGNVWSFVGNIAGGPYINQGIALPYDKLVPLPDPTEDYDEEEVIRTFNTPSRLEQLYYDASTPPGRFKDRYRAVWLICNAVEAGARHNGKENAAALYQLGCLAGSAINRGCYTKWDVVLGNYSGSTASGRRVRGLIIKGWVDEAFELNLDVQLINYGIQLLVGLSVGKAALGRTGAPTVPKAEPPKPTISTEPPKPAPPTEPPNVEAPKVEPPKTEAPKTEPPKAEPTKTEPTEPKKPTKPSKGGKPEKPLTTGKAKPVPDDPQRGVRAALERVKQKIATDQAELTEALLCDSTERWAVMDTSTTGP